MTPASAHPQKRLEDLPLCAAKVPRSQGRVHTEARERDATRPADRTPGLLLLLLSRAEPPAPASNPGPSPFQCATLHSARSEAYLARLLLPAPAAWMGSGGHSPFPSAVPGDTIAAF